MTTYYSVWDNWNSFGSSSTSTYTTDYSYNSEINTAVWHVWVSDSSYTTSGATWEGWITQDSVDCDCNCNYTVVAPHKLSKKEQERLRLEEEEREKRWKAEREESNRRYEEMQKEKKAAEKKAQVLLGELIGKDQLEVYRKTGRVFVKGKDYDYIIQKQGYVKRIEKDLVRDLCIHLKDKYSMPDTDNVVALKLFVEADEYAFNEMANKHGVFPLSEKPKEAACMGR